MKETNIITKRNRQEKKEDEKRWLSMAQKKSEIAYRKHRRIWYCGLESLDNFLEIVEINRRWAICRLIAWRYNNEADYNFENDNMKDYDVHEVLLDELRQKRYWTLEDICRVVNSTELSRYETMKTEDISWYDGHEGIWQSFIDNMA